MIELAPLNGRRSFTGVISPKPWEYTVTATLAHLETPDALATVLRTLRAQSERPYLMVVDTGSSRETCERLEAMRAPDCEIHYIRGHAWRHGSSVIAAACDLAMVTCRSEYLYLTQTDVFLRRRDFLADMRNLCAEHPVVGYEMSPRGWASERWKGMVGHTATMVHMPTMRKIGATWDMQRGAEWHELEYRREQNGWPDTETTFNEILRVNGVIPHFVGHDENGTNYCDENLRHCRSYSVMQLYGNGDAQRNWVADAIVEAEENLRRWGEP